MTEEPKVLCSIDEETLAQGMSYETYRSQITQNQDVFDEVYDNPAFDEADLDTLQRLPPLHVVAIGEDWCPDVFHTLPTWARLAENLPGWSCHIFPRDQHPQLMDNFLYRLKSKRIPVYAFFDQNRSLQVWWSGRSREAQEVVDGALRGRALDELSKDERLDLRKVFEDGYRGRFRRLNFEEILTLLRAFFHTA